MELRTVFVKDVEFNFVWIPPGQGLIGCPEDYPKRFRIDTLPEMKTIDKGFWMQTTPVTQKQWKKLMRKNPSHFQEYGLESPVESVSWYMIRHFIHEFMQQTHMFVQLPSEIEWEYACRAGSQTLYHFGDDESKLDDYAWFWENSNQTTHPVGKKLPNAWDYMTCMEM